MAIEDLTDEEARRLYQEQIAEGSRAASEKSALETVVDIPEAVAGMAVEGVKGLGSAAWGALTGEGESYSDSLRRIEDAAKERLGQEVYENTIADAGDIIGMLPYLGAAVYRAAQDDDPYAAGGEIGQVMGEDAVGGIGWTVNNLGKASKAFPLATLMAITGAGRVAGNVGRIASKSARGAEIKGALKKADRLSNWVTSKIEAGTLTREKKLVKDREPGQLYTAAIGDTGMTIKDLMSPAIKGGAAGLLLGVPEYGAILGLTGKLGSGILAKKNPGGIDLSGKMARLLRHTSGQARASDEVAIRGLFDDAPQAEASLNAAATMLNDMIRQGVSFEGESGLKAFDMVADDSGLRALMDSSVEFDATGRAIGKSFKNADRQRKQAKNRLRISEDVVKQLDEAEASIKELVGEDSAMASSTKLRLQDLLSGESVQYASDPRVMDKIISRLRSEADGATVKNLKDMGGLIQNVAQGPIYGNRNINPVFRLGDNNAVSVRDLATQAFNELSPENRRDVLAKVSTAILQENRQIARGIASSKALDFESNRIFKDPESKAAYDNALTGEGGSEAAAAVYADNLINSSFIYGDALPMVSPRGISFTQVTRHLFNKYINNDDAFAALLTEKLGPGAVLDADQFAKAKTRLREIADQLDDVDTQNVDIGKMGSDLARTVAADGLEGARLRQRMESMRNRGAITEDAYNDMVATLGDDFDVAMQTPHDGRQIRAPLQATYGWLNMADQNTKPVLQWMSRMSSHIKAAYTTLNPASHANNMISNVGLLSMHRGVDPATVVTSAIVNKRRFDKWKKRKKDDTSFTDRETRIFDKVSKMGFVEGDLITAEIRSLANQGLYNGASPVVATNLAKAGREVGRVAQSVKDKAGAAYRWGDTTFKFDEAIRSMEKTFDMLDELEDGQYLDIATSPRTVTRVTKKDGKLTVPRGRRSVDDVVASNARLRANELFFDYSQRPGLLRWFDKTGGVTGVVNPYLTWYWKSLGIGGKGLLRKVAPFEADYKTNSPTVLRQMAMQDFLTTGRKAVAINAMRSEFDRNPEALEAAMKYAPDEVRTLMFMDLADPNVLAYRDVSSMNYLSPASTYYQFLGTALGKLTGSERAEFLRAAGEAGFAKPLMELTGLSGSPVLDIYDKLKEGKARPEDWLTPFLGVGITQAIMGVGGRELFGRNASSFERMKSLPENIRPTAEEYYFRRMTSVGWNRGHLFGREGGRPGKLSRYFSQLKRNLKDNLVKPVLDDYRDDIVPGTDVLEALDKANEMYLRRVNEVEDAYQKLYPDYAFPKNVDRLIKIRKNEL